MFVAREIVILVLGIGNPLLADDGIGINIVKELKGIEGIEAKECFSSIDLFEALEMDYEHIFIVDAVVTGGTPGTIYEASLPNDNLAKTSTDIFPKVSSHDLDLEMLAPYSDRITILAVEAKDVTSFSERCTPEVERSISEMLNIIIGRSKRIL